jgi:hypothetical protein
LVVGRVGVGVVALVVEAVALFVGVFYCVVKGGGGGDRVGRIRGV